VPAAVLAPLVAAPSPDSLEPSVLCDIRIEGTSIASVERSQAQASSAAPVGSVDLDGALVFPGFIDSHVHLDKTHTWERAPNRTGTFANALEALGADHLNWSRADIMRRAGFALHCAWEHGTRLIRTHVDTWLPGGEVNHAAMQELRETWRGRIALQTVPLTGVSNYAGSEGDAIADMALKYGAVALGGWSPMSRELPAQVDRLLAIARDRNVGVDLHVDENGDPAEEVLRTVAEAVIRNDFRLPVVCGHCCSLTVQEPGRQRSTLALVKEAGIRVISLPLCNLYLQDRPREGTSRTPRWRGLTLIHELMDLGVPVACASDNVRDAFFAYGDYDMAEVYIESVRLAHLDNRLAESVGVVGRTAAEIIGRSDMGRVDVGVPAHLVVFAARSFSEFLSRPGGARRLVDGENIRVSRPPGYEELD